MTQKNPVTVNGRFFDGRIIRPAGHREAHIDCPCWMTGTFEQVPCPWHDGMRNYPAGSFAASEAGQKQRKEN